MPSHLDPSAETQGAQAHRSGVPSVKFAWARRWLRTARGQAVKTPIGWLPTPDGLDTTGLNVPASDLAQQSSVDIEGWKKEAADVPGHAQQPVERSAKHQINQTQTK